VPLADTARIIAARSATATPVGVCDHVCRPASLPLRVLPRRSRGYIGRTPGWACRFPAMFPMEAAASATRVWTATIWAPAPEDLGRTMVQLGMAWSFVRYSQDYVGVETQAKAENLGVHGWQCEPAWEWRAHQRK